MQHKRRIRTRTAGKRRVRQNKSSADTDAVAERIAAKMRGGAASGAEMGADTAQADAPAPDQDSPTTADG